jgi:hypothetical protein
MKNNLIAVGSMNKALTIAFSNHVSLVFPNLTVTYSESDDNPILVCNKSKDIICALMDEKHNSNKLLSFNIDCPADLAIRLEAIASKYFTVSHTNPMTVKHGDDGSTRCVFVPYRVDLLEYCSNKDFYKDISFYSEDLH